MQCKVYIVHVLYIARNVYTRGENLWKLHSLSTDIHSLSQPAIFTVWSKIRAVYKYEAWQPHWIIYKYNGKHTKNSWKHPVSKLLLYKRFEFHATPLNFNGSIRRKDKSTDKCNRISLNRNIFNLPKFVETKPSPYFWGVN